MPRSFVRQFCLAGLVSVNLLCAAGSHVFVALSSGATSISEIDATTGAALRVLPTVPGAYNLTLSPDGKQAYVLAPSDYLDGCPCGNNSVTVWNLATGELVATYALSGSPWELYFSPDGHFAYVVGSDQTVQGNNVIDTLHLFTLDTLTQKVLVDQPFPALTGYDQVVQNAISPDGKRLYVITSLNAGVTSIGVFALPSLKLLQTFSLGPQFQEVPGIAATIDGKSLLVSSDYESNGQDVNTITAYSTQSFHETASVTLTGNPSNIVLSPDGQYAYTSVHVNQPMDFYNIQIITLPGLQPSLGPAVDDPGPLAISPDGTKLLVGLQIIDLQNESVLVNSVDSLTDQVFGQFLPDGDSVWILNQRSSQVAIIPEGATAPTHELATGQFPLSIGFGPGETIDVLDDGVTLISIDAANGHVVDTVPLQGIFDPQAAEFLAYGGGQIYIAGPQQVESYNAKTKQFTLLALPPPDYPYYTIIEGIVTNTSGSQLYVDFIGGSGIGGPGDDGGIMSFNTSTNQELAFVPLNPHGAFVLNTAGTTIYANTLNGQQPSLVNSISVVDTQSNSVANVFPEPGYLEFDSMALSPDGNTLYALDRRAKTILIINTASGLATGSYMLTYNPTSMALTPDGSELYISNGDTKNVTVIDTATTTQSLIYVGSPSSFVAIH